MAAMTEQVLDLLGERFGLALTAGRATGGGQGRTYYADLAGTPVVVKWGLDPDLPEKLPYVAGQVPELRGRGIPVPRILAHGPLDDRSYGWVLERLAGTTATVLDEALLGARTMEQLDDLLAGVDVVLSDDVLDRIDEIVPPGTDIGILDQAYVPPAIEKTELRRRPLSERSAA